MLNLIAAFLSMVVATALAIAGVDWITIGHGLNPWLAFPLAALFSLIGFGQCVLAVQVLDADSLRKEFQRKRNRFGF